MRADAVEVLNASPDRVTPPCPYAGPGRCGGCDFQHVALHRQRALKADVVREQMARLAHLDSDVDVEPVPGDAEGLGWRTRVEFAVDAEGRAGLRRHRSHDVVPVDHCRIAAPGIDLLRVTEGQWPGVELVDAVAPSVGEPLAVVVPGPVVPVVHEQVDATWQAHDGSEQSRSRELAVAARGFWQVHPGAARTFVEAVLGAARVATRRAGPRPVRRGRAVRGGPGRRRGRRRARSSPSRPTPAQRSSPARTSPTGPTSPC